MGGQWNYGSMNIRIWLAVSCDWHWTAQLRGLWEKNSIWKQKGNRDPGAKLLRCCNKRQAHRKSARKIASPMGYSASSQRIIMNTAMVSVQNHMTLTHARLLLYCCYKYCWPCKTFGCSIYTTGLNLLEQTVTMNVNRRRVWLRRKNQNAVGRAFRGRQISLRS
ncbi:hypothetical protein PO909_004143 [Leuciscus waleckii]